MMENSKDFKYFCPVRVFPKSAIRTISFFEMSNNFRITDQIIGIGLCAEKLTEKQTDEPTGATKSFCPFE